EAPEMDPDLVEAVVEHRFEPIGTLEWRNGRLDFDSLPDLLRSLTTPPRRPGLRLAEEALDETVLRKLAADETVARRARGRGSLMRLWGVGQLAGFQQTPLDAHPPLVRGVFAALTGPGGRLTDDWVAPRFAAADRAGGEIDQLSARLAAVRTLAYVAHRPDWLRGAAGWRDKTRALEERLS